MPAAERREVAVELVALAIKYRDLGGPPAEVAIGQLFILAGALLGDYFRAEALFKSQGVDLSGAAKFIDREVKKRPVTTSPLTQGQNLFALLKAQPKPKKRR